MDTRVAILAVLVVAVALAGCEGGVCQPGETSIDDVTPMANETVSVGGAITEFSESRIVITDGTGDALLVSLQGYDTGAADVGDCVVAEGTVVGDGESGEYDVVIRTSSVERRG